MIRSTKQINEDILLLYEEQYQTYYKLYEEGNTFFFDYAVLVCEQAVYTIHTFIRPSKESELLLAKMESLLALLKLALEKMPCDKTKGTLQSFQRFSKKPYLNTKKNYIS